VLSEVIELKHIFDFSKPCTQNEFALIIGVSQQAVSDMQKRNVIASGETLGIWLTKYCSYIREFAAGRAGNGDIDLVTERAMLARSQRERIDMQNEITRREYGPIIALEQSISDCMARVASKLDTVPGKLKLGNDKLTASDLDTVSAIIAEVRNDIATMTIDWFDEQTNEDSDIDVDLED
jgi:phage terminase Nu1 subunit (DNA packaging protein)